MGNLKYYASILIIIERGRKRLSTESEKNRENKPTEKRIDKILIKYKVNGFLDYSLKGVVLTTEGGS